MCLSKQYTITILGVGEEVKFDIAQEEGGKLWFVVPNGIDAYGHRINKKWSIEYLLKEEDGTGVFPLDRYYVIDSLMHEICKLNSRLTEALSDKAKLVETKES